MNGPPRWLGFTVSAALAITLLAIAIASAHPMPQPAKELYFKHRCDAGNVRACIHRGALHWGAPFRTGVFLATRETDLHPELCNGERPGGPKLAGRLNRACGLFQFKPSTWAFTPYRMFSRFSAKYSSLAWAWMWTHGWSSAWAT